MASNKWNIAYCRCSNYASFLILCQNATFQTGSFQWCVTLRKLIFYCCVTRISWLQMWTVIVACHCWCVKLRHIRDMAETSLVVRDGNRNHTAIPRFSLASGVIRGYHVYQRIWTPHVRESNNGKRNRKRTRPICFDRGNAIEIRNGIMFDFYPGQPHFIQISTTLLVRLPQYRKQSILWELFELACIDSFSPVFAIFFIPHLCRIRFLIMRHISNVAS